MAKTLLLCLLLLSAIWAQVPCDTLYEIRGYADWLKGEVELPSVKVRVPIDTSGMFQIGGLCPGKYQLRVWHSGHVVMDTSVNVPSEDFLFLQGSSIIHSVVIEAFRVRHIYTESLTRLSCPEASIAKCLEHLPGIFLSQAGPLIQKPILEGLRGTRVAYWQAGVPLGSQQWGEEHAPEIDPLSTEEIEVHLGPSPVLHGTEAVGGTIVCPMPPLCCLSPIEGRFLCSGLYNGRGGVIGARIQGTYKDWGYRLQGTFQKIGTLQTPSYFLTGTGSQQLHGSAAFQRLWRRWQLGLFYAQYNASVGIFQGMQVGNLSDLQRAFSADMPAVSSEFSHRLSPPFQRITHELTMLHISYLLPNENFLKLTIGRQYNRRQEHDVVGIYSVYGIALDLQLTTHYISLGYETHKLKTALFTQIQRNYSQYAYFIPSYRRYQVGGYAFYSWRGWEAGVRLEPLLYDFYRGVLSKEGLYQPSKKHRFPAMGAELNRYWKLAMNFSILRAQLAFLTRAPNPAELYAYGYHQARGAFEIGANQLSTEPTLCLRSVYQAASGEIMLSGYYSWAFIWQRLGEPILSLRGASLNLFYEQGPALWFSIGARKSYKLSLRAELEIKGSYVWGSCKRDEWQPLPLLPPLLLSPTLRWKGQTWQINFSWQHHFRQFRYSTDTEYFPPPAGYGLLSADLRYTKGSWVLMLSGENLLNRAYRAYPDLLRFYAHQIGRQIRLTVEYSFRR
ncbi:MAG: TonB-dependent receptor [Bacteroidia bacterium]|nr:TonB-dependent receptor [Bacteroidia bacterium]MDW8133879.1 TonB-dependent receptor [Bacteroidia bacterium]